MKTRRRLIRSGWTNGLKQAVLLVASCVLTLITVNRALGEGAVFLLPAIDGVRVDRCLYFAKDCDEPAATAFCRSRGHGRALAWEWDYTRPTRIQGDGRTCDGDYCGGFTTITCGEVADPSPPSSVHFLDASDPGRLTNTATIRFGTAFLIEARYDSAQDDQQKRLTLSLAGTSIALDLDRRGDGATYRSGLLMLMPLED